MPRPGVIVKSRASKAARGEPTDSAVWFVTGFTQKGPITPRLMKSLDAFKALYGDRVSAGQLFDAAELFFSEGGADLYVTRVVGPAPTLATRTLVDRAGVPLNTLRIDAKYHGNYASTGTTALRVDVNDAASGLANAFDIIVEENAVEVERFVDLTSPQDAADKITAGSAYITATNLNSATVAPNNNPAVIANAALAGGTDDNASAVEAQWTAALDKFTEDLGPGQVSAPGRTTVAAHQALIDHARTKNRTAYLDAADQASKATLKTARDAIKAYNESARAGLFGTWVTIPPIAGSVTERNVPGSAFAAGVTARTDALEGTAGAAPAGEVSTARFATGIRTPAGGFTDADYEELNLAGINMTQFFKHRGTQLYGFRSVTTDADWIQLTAQRLRMSLLAKLRDRAATFVFRTVDGRGHVFAELAGALTGVLLTEYALGALYGTTPDDAFSVDVSDAVNTAATIAAGEIKAVVAARFSPFAELVQLEVIKVAVTGTV